MHIQHTIGYSLQMQCLWWLVSVSFICQLYYLTTVCSYSTDQSSLPLAWLHLPQNSEAALHLFIKHSLCQEDIHRLSLKDTKYLVVYALHTLASMPLQP